MALTKEVIEDKIEVVDVHKHVGIRTTTIIKDNNEEVSRSHTRRVLPCRQNEYDGTTWTHTDTDISGESTEVQAICNAAWTQAVKDARDAYMEANSLQNG